LLFTSRFDALRLPLGVLWALSLSKRLKALSLSKGTSPERLASYVDSRQPLDKLGALARRNGTSPGRLGCLALNPTDPSDPSDFVR
jgi:hypothetical protein